MPILAATKTKGVTGLPAGITHQWRFSTGSWDGITDPVVPFDLLVVGPGWVVEGFYVWTDGGFSPGTPSGTLIIGDNSNAAGFITAVDLDAGSDQYSLNSGAYVASLPFYRYLFDSDTIRATFDWTANLAPPTSGGGIVKIFARIISLPDLTELN